MKFPISFPADTPKRWFFIFTLLWIGLVFTHYFSFAAFFDFSFLGQIAADIRTLDWHRLWENLIGSIKIIFCFLAVLLTLWRWGWKLSLWMGWTQGNMALRFCQAAGLGILFFNGLWLGLGLNGLWDEPLLLLLGLSAFGLALWDLWANAFIFQKFPRAQKLKKWDIGLAALGGLILLLSLAQSLVPEVYYDALVYHLSTLEFWRHHHGIADFYTNLYSYYPFGGELYLLDGFFFFDGEAAKMLNVFAAGLCALAVAGWAAEESGLSEGFLAWAMVLSFPLISSTSWTAQNDVLLGFYVVLFIRELWRWGEGASSSALGAGIWGGAALSTKYTAVVWLGGALLAALLLRRKTFFKKRWGEWAVLLSLPCIFVAPWLLRNFAYAGNSFYPYFSSWMGGRVFSTQGMMALLEDHEAVFRGSFGITEWLHRVLFYDLDKTIGPLLFSFLPFLFWKANRKTMTRYLLILSALYLLLGFLGSHQLRLMIPAFCLCFAAISMVVGELKEKTGSRLWSCLVLVFGLWSFLSLCRLAVTYYQSDRIWFGSQTRQEYLATLPQTSSYFSLAQISGMILPAESRLLVAGDARGLYYPVSAYTCSAFDDPVLSRLAVEEKDGKGISHQLKEMGMDAVAVSGEEGIRLSQQYHSYALKAEDWVKIEDFIQHHTDLIYLSSLNGIYRLRPVPIERKQRISNLLLLFRDASSNP